MYIAHIKAETTLPQYILLTCNNLPRGMSPIITKTILEEFGIL